MLTRTSKRQRRLYGLRKKAFAPYLRDEMEMDAKYRADLAKDPAAARWLSAFNEETLKAVRIRGEAHVLSREQHLEADRVRKRKQRGRDPVAFEGLRSRLSGNIGRGSEDEVIAEIDRQRAVQLREETDDELG